MRIGELAARTGVSRRSLRYYESRGLLASTRTHGGHRLYPPDAVDHVIRIQELIAAGLSVRMIGKLLPRILAPPAERTSFLDEALRAHGHRLAAATADLHRARGVLDQSCSRSSCRGSYQTVLPCRRAMDRLPADTSSAGAELRWFWHGTDLALELWTTTARTHRPTTTPGSLAATWSSPDATANRCDTSTCSATCTTSPTRQTYR